MHMYTTRLRPTAMQLASMCFNVARRLKTGMKMIVDPKMMVATVCIARQYRRIPHVVSHGTEDHSLVGMSTSADSRKQDRDMAYAIISLPVNGLA